MSITRNVQDLSLGLTNITQQQKCAKLFESEVLQYYSINSNCSINDDFNILKCQTTKNHYNLLHIIVINNTTEILNLSYNPDTLYVYCTNNETILNIPFEIDHIILYKNIYELNNKFMIYVYNFIKNYGISCEFITINNFKLFRYNSLFTDGLQTYINFMKNNLFVDIVGNRDDFIQNVKFNSTTINYFDKMNCVYRMTIFEKMCEILSYILNKYKIKNNNDSFIEKFVNKLFGYISLQNKKYLLPVKKQIKNIGIVYACHIKNDTKVIDYTFENIFNGSDCSIEMVYSTNKIEYDKNWSNTTITKVENIGYDFYKYCVGLKKLNNKNYVLLINDSIILTTNLKFIINLLNYIDYDLIGFVDSVGFKYHYQSHTWILKSSVYKLLLDLCRNSENLSISEIIYNFEIGFSNKIICSKHKTLVLYPYGKNNLHITYQAINVGVNNDPLKFYNQTLYPIIKVRFLFHIIPPKLFELYQQNKRVKLEYLINKNTQLIFDAFDLEVYKLNNPDFPKNWTNEKYYQHFQTFGLKEHRIYLMDYHKCMRDCYLRIAQISGNQKCVELLMNL